MTTQPSTRVAACDPISPAGAGAGKPSRPVWDFGQREFAPAAFRVTVATFNLRALRVVTAVGFHAIGSFRASTDGRSYEMLVRPAPRSAGAGRGSVT
jgi:hypothetical protein